MTEPRLIACFHGGGSNGQIMHVQCARLQRALQQLGNFEFVYFDAPFECNAGPGVLPFFKDCTPFRTWFKTDGTEAQKINGSGYDNTGTDGLDRVWSLLRSRKDTSPSDWAGVLGFSQGTRIVGGLLLDQQYRTTASIPNDFKLKFGVLCMGGGAPMESRNVICKQTILSVDCHNN
jgi:hypothetical protein